MRIFVRISLAVICAACVASCVRVTVRFDPPGPYCNAFDFPAQWTFPALPPPEPPSPASTLAFRKLRDRGNWIVIAATDFHYDAVTSTNFWKLDLSRLSALVPATEEEWAHGSISKVQTEDARGIDTGEYGEIINKRQTVPFEGRQLRFLGHRISAHPGPVSPGNRWIAVQSYDGENDGPLLPSHGEYFIEIYEASSARKVFQVSGKFEYADGPGLMGETGWLEDHFLVNYRIPIVNRLVICDVLKAGK